MNDEAIAATPNRTCLSRPTSEVPDHEAEEEPDVEAEGGGVTVRPASWARSPNEALIMSSNASTALFRRGKRARPNNDGAAAPGSAAAGVAFVCFLDGERERERERERARAEGAWACRLPRSTGIGTNSECTSVVRPEKRCLPVKRPSSHMESVKCGTSASN
jgi:hypothetical protein